MINVSPSAWGLLPFIVKSNVLVKVANDVGVFMNALEFVLKPPLTRLRSLVVAVALPFNCRVVKSMVVELAAVAPRTPTANAALAEYDLKVMWPSPLADIRRNADPTEAICTLMSTLAIKLTRFSIALAIKL